MQPVLRFRHRMIGGCPHGAALIDVRMYMARSLFSLVLILAAGSFGLPAGWCCRAPTARTEFKAAPIQGYCGHKLPRAPAPVGPVRTCCCPLESAASPPVKAQSPAPSHWLLFTAGDPADELSLASAPAAPLPLLADSGPPLRVLQCVWLC